NTPEHAAFAIQLITNPEWDRSVGRYEKKIPLVAESPEPYVRIKNLLDKHIDLFRSNNGANTLAILGMRTAMRMGDPLEALKIAEAVPTGASVRAEPDFLWMVASVHFLSREY